MSVLDYKVMRRHIYLEKSRPCQLSTLVCKSSVTRSSTWEGVWGRSNCFWGSGERGIDMLSRASAAGETMSSGSGRHFPSMTSTVIKQVKLCCCRLRLSVGNSVRTVTVGAGMGFLMLGRGLGMSAAMDWRSYSILRLRDSSVAWLLFLSC